MVVVEMCSPNVHLSSSGTASPNPAVPSRSNEQPVIPDDRLFSFQDRRVSLVARTRQASASSGSSSLSVTSASMAAFTAAT